MYEWMLKVYGNELLKVMPIHFQSTIGEAQVIVTLRNSNQNSKISNTIKLSWVDVKVMVF